MLGLRVLASLRHVSTPSFNVMGFVESSFVLEPGNNAVHRHRRRRSHLTFKAGIWWALFRIKWFLQNLNYHCSTFLVLITFISKSMISLTVLQNSVVFSLSCVYVCKCMCGWMQWSIIQLHFPLYVEVCECTWPHGVVKNSLVFFPLCLSVRVYVWMHAVVNNSVVFFPSMFMCMSVCVDTCSG